MSSGVVNLTESGVCHFPYGVYEPSTATCQCRNGFFALYADPEHNCGYTDQVWKILVRALLLALSFLSLMLWATKLFYLFRNVSKNVFDLPKMMAYSWLIGCLAGLVLLVACEARMLGDPLVYLAIVCFSMFEFSTLCLVFYTNWFILTCLSLLYNMRHKTKPVSRLHFAVYGFFVVIFISSVMVSTPFLMPQPLTSVNAPPSPAFATGILLTLFISLEVVLVYNAVVFLVPIIAVLCRYGSDPPAVVRLLKTFWILHFALGVTNLIMFFALTALLVETSISPSFNSPTWSLALTLTGVTIVFQLTLTAYCTINHKPAVGQRPLDDDGDDAPNAHTPLMARRPRSPGRPDSIFAISPSVFSDVRSQELFITRASDWDFRGSAEIDTPLHVIDGSEPDNDDDS